MPPRHAVPHRRASRRAQLVEAVFRIVRRDGVEHVSVRNVARECGMSVGALRHYFVTQAELLAFALSEVERRIRDRLADVDTSGSPREVLDRVLHQLVPMTAESRVEHEIWLAFVGRALVDPALHTLNLRVYDELRALFAGLVARAVGPGQHHEWETERLYALVHGLVLHAALRPMQWPPERLSAVLRYHLASLGSQVPGPVPA